MHETDPGSDHLTEEQHAVLTRLVDDLGERVASEKLGIGVDSLLRVLARRPNVRRGTMALLQRSLERLQNESKQ